mgnify:CR=1 FL=1
MSDGAPSSGVVSAMAAELRGTAITGQQAADIAADLRRLLPHAAAVGAGNDLNAEPGQFAATLRRLSGLER